MRTARKLAIWIPIIVVAAVVSFLRLPLYAISPGPAREVVPLIEVNGHEEYPSEGRFVMTTIEFDQLAPVGALVAWLDPDTAVVSEDELFAPGETPQEEERRAISQMDQSKIDAVSVVLKLLTDYPKEHRPGALVESVVAGCAAEGRLYPGDLILSIDGERIDDRAEASAAIEAVPSGESVTFEIRAGGKVQDVDLVRRPCGGEREPLVGVSLVDNFPFRVRIASGEIGGPSAGLMWALGLYDLLTPGDLTGGRTIAGTGQIDLFGRVHPIGGIGEKVVAAGRAGASVFLVPKGNLDEARAAGDHGARVVPVSSFQDALDYLEATA